MKITKFKNFQIFDYRPQELDEAARRRLTCKLYIPLPDRESRKEMISNLISAENHSLSDEQIDELSLKTEGYSGADIKDLCRESAMQSFRESSISDQFTDIQKTDIRGITFQDFITSLKVVKPSVASDDLIQYDIWNQKYGTLLASNNAL